MIISRVSKMGVSRIINLPTDKVIYGDRISIKPKGKKIKIITKVSSKGDRRIAVIPKIYHDIFGEDGVCYIEILP